MLIVIPNALESLDILHLALLSHKLIVIATKICIDMNQSSKADLGDNIKQEWHPVAFIQMTHRPTCQIVTDAGIFSIS